jgi:hypothetical protein
MAGKSKCKYLNFLVLIFENENENFKKIKNLKIRDEREWKTFGVLIKQDENRSKTVF